MKQVIVLALLSIQEICIASSTTPRLNEIWKLSQFGHEIAIGIKKNFDQNELSIDNVNNQLTQIIDQLQIFSAEWNSSISCIDQELKYESQISSERVEFILLKELFEEIVKISEMYKDFSQYHYTNNSTMNKGIEITSNLKKEKLFEILRKMFHIVKPFVSIANEKTLLVLLINEMQNGSRTCYLGQSVQQRIYEIYTAIILSELRGLTMILFSYAFQATQKNGTYVDEINHAVSEFIFRVQNYAVITEKAMTLAPTEIHRCHPKELHKYGDTYLELKGLLQTYIVNEINIHPSGHCRNTCDDIEKTKNYRIYSSHNYEKFCPGQITNCKYGGGAMKFCALPESHSRRYTWFKDNSGTVYGDDDECYGQEISAPGWSMGIFWRCDSCVCICEATEPSTQGIIIVSLLPAQSNFKSNMVATSIRFVEKNHMIHIQIQEGKLMPNGKILNGSESWVPVRDYKLDRKKGESYRFANLVRDVHFCVINSERMMLLDDIIVPPRHVVIGARFQFHREIGTDGALRLEVLTSPFDYSAGSIARTRFLTRMDYCYWMSYESTPEFTKYNGTQRTEIKFNRPDNPLKFHVNTSTVHPYSFVKFHQSDLKKDAGQSTIPFFDAQKVSTVPMSPLQGIGLFHKGHNDGASGGFLAFRVFSLNQTQYLNTTLPDNIRMIYEKFYSDSLPATTIKIT